jgi:hypothetical protein
LLIGAVIAISSVVSWAHAGYGHLPPVEMMRRTVPSMMFLMLGTQICFSACWVCGNPHIPASLAGFDKAC